MIIILISRGKVERIGQVVRYVGIVRVALYERLGKVEEWVEARRVGFGGDDSPNIFSWHWCRILAFGALVFVSTGGLIGGALFLLNPLVLAG